MILLTKKLRFESAHRLAKNYVGKCAEIHGHSWNGEIQVGCTKLDEFGMGVDFGDIKKFNKIIEDELDHKILLYEKDEALINFCQRKISFLPMNIYSNFQICKRKRTSALIINFENYCYYLFCGLW